MKLLVLLFLHFTFTTSQSNCITNPTDPACVDFTLSKQQIEDDIASLCKSMPNMPGCTVDEICEKDKYEDDSYCKPFTVLKILCEDMLMMHGCSNYRTMCKTNGSVVEQCKAQILPIPTTSQAKSMVVSICQEMSMEDCSECNAQASNCEVLEVYSNLCKSMPDMQQCATWKEFCKDVPDWPLCSLSSSEGVMRMYLHSEFNDYILFKQWVPSSDLEFFGTIVFCVIFCFLHELFKFVRGVLERKWKVNREEMKNHIGSEVEALLSIGLESLKGWRVQFEPFLWKSDIPRSLLHFCDVLWGMLSMLLVMTYNVYILFAVCIGYGLGFLVFGRNVYQEGSKTESCCQ